MQNKNKIKGAPHWSAEMSVSVGHICRGSSGTPAFVLGCNGAGGEIVVALDCGGAGGGAFKEFFGDLVLGIQKLHETAGDCGLFRRGELSRASMHISVRQPYSDKEPSNAEASMRASMP